MVLLRNGWRTDGRFLKLTRTWGDAAHWRAAVGRSILALFSESAECRITVCREVK